MGLLSDLAMVGAARWTAAAALVALYAALCAAVGWRERRKHQAAQAQAASLAAAREGLQALLVVYASQTGQAQELAEETARLLHAAGEPVQLCPVHQLTPEALAQARCALWVVSTCGEGDPPDHAAAFASHTLASAPHLAHLHYGLLALGDRQYTHFCGFGRQVDAWLQRCGATRLFDTVEMDNGDAQALQQWQHHLGQVAHVSDLPAWQAPEFADWVLARRTHLNPGSAGGAVFHLELLPSADLAGAAVAWESGDLVQVRAPQDPDHPREYSVASIASDGSIHLLVRQAVRGDGALGLASGWLTQGAAVGAAIPLRLRAHSNFRLEGNAQRPLILVGNGTGLAGLRAHLRARAAVGAGPNWLLFGERNAAYDFHHQAELEGWHRQGTLQRLDVAFSRDQPSRVYVQHLLAAEADTVRAWVAQGAAVYVCGSLQGMAQAVDSTLRQILGTDALDHLLREGRYRRDVY